MVDDPFEGLDTTRFTDADWAAVNKLKCAYEDGGQRRLSAELEELKKNPVLYITIMHACAPERIREVMKDVMADQGITEQDLRDAIRKSESPAGDQ
jgi:hypothetical protein